MGATMKQSPLSASGQRGFTLIETMIAIAIMSIAVVTLLGVFGIAVATMQNSEENLVSRQKALEALESIYTARDAQQITFAQISNIASGGIFTSGPVPLWSAGPDGILGTVDDVPFAAAGACPAGPECITLPGPDGILGTPDDTALSLSNFTRQILISTVLESDGVTINPNLKQITVTISYTTGGSVVPRSYTVTALISAFR